MFGWTIVNLLIHILGTAPEAGEATGGWLHGGLIIDFIGQGMLLMVCTAHVWWIYSLTVRLTVESPVSKYRLAATDLTILSLQLVMLAATISKQALLNNVTHTRRGGDNGTHRQDLDSEERGEIRGRRSGEEIEGNSPTTDGDSHDTGDSETDSGEGSTGRSNVIPNQRHNRRRRRQQQRRRNMGSISSAISTNDNRPLLNHSRWRSTGAPRNRRIDIGVEQEASGRDDDGGRYVQYSGQLVIAELSIADAVRWQWNHGSPGSVIAGSGMLSGGMRGIVATNRIAIDRGEGLENR